MAGTAGAILGRRIATGERQALEQRLEAMAHLLADLAPRRLEAGGEPDLQARFERLGRRLGVRFTLLDGGGRVLADSWKDPATMDRHDQRPEVLAARSHGRGLSVRKSDSVGVSMVYLCLPVRDAPGAPAGYARVALPVTRVDEQVGEVWHGVGLGASLASLAALGLGFLLARQITRPLDSMTRVARSMAAGDYEKRLPEGRGDEIGILARALNRMARACQDRMETISADRSELRAILGSMIEGVVAVDRSGTIVHANAAAVSLLELDTAGVAEPVEGRAFREVVRLRELGDLVEQVLRSRTQENGVVTLTASPRDRILEARLAPLGNGGAHRTGAVLVLSDLSERARLDAMRRDFVANVSHELKTPLSALRALLETLLDDPLMDPATRERFLRKACDQTGRMGNLVADLLTLSRLEAAAGGPAAPAGGGSGAADPENGGRGGLLQSAGLVDLGEVAAAVAGDAAARAGERGLALEVELGEDPAAVEGDRASLEQLVSNLVDNALKYTEPGGRVLVAVGFEDGSVVLRVEDTGIGIAPEHQDRVFERFYRVDRARSRELGGTGLGLAIVRHVVRAHRAQLTLSSEPGRGSRFRVLFPPAGGEPTGTREDPGAAR